MKPTESGDEASRSSGFWNPDMAQRATRSDFAVCLNNEGAEDGFVRIVDESGEDYLYPAEHFAPLALDRRGHEALAALAPPTERAASRMARARPRNAKRRT